MGSAKDNRNIFERVASHHFQNIAEF